MRLLLDSHTLIWVSEKNSRLSPTASTELASPANQRLLSPAIYWEVAIKTSLGKLTLSEPLQTFIDRAIQDLVLVILPIQTVHAAAVATLPMHHRDPFDRMLVAQVIVEQIAVVVPTRLLTLMASSASGSSGFNTLALAAIRP